MTTQQPEALRLAWLLELAPEDGVEPQTTEDAAAELRRQHARIAELEAQLEAIGAGGVAPLIGQQTRDSFTAADMATAAEEGYRDGAAELRRLHAYCQELEAQVILDCMTHIQNPAPQPSPTAQAADSVPAVSDLPPLPAPDLRDVGTKPQEIKEFLKGYATEYARTAIAARAPADSVLEDAARLEIDLFNDLNRIYGNTLTAYAKELCRLGYRKTNAARKQGETNEH